MTGSTCTTTVLICSLFSFCAGGIHKKLKYFEILESVKVHSVGSGSANFGSGSAKVVLFTTLNRKTFKISGIDHQNRKVPIGIQTEDFYSGQATGVANSTVHAYWEDGCLVATIVTPEEIYSIEPSWRHLPSLRNHAHIFYKISDIISTNHSSTYLPDRCSVLHAHKTLHAKDNYTFVRAIKNTETPRRKRSTSDKSVCTIMLVADFKFHQGVGQGKPFKTASYMIGVIQQVNAVFGSATWDNSRQLKGLGFEIEEIVIYYTPTHVEGNHFNRNVSQWNPTFLLEAFSANADSAKFCTAHLFTYEAFEDNVVGLAYTASPKLHVPGGICSPMVKKGEKLINYNTGWSTYKNVNKEQILLQEAILITAHELGHTWGSEHDPSSKDCAPSGLLSKGKYLMYPYTVSGYEPNNRKFSPCSKMFISAVLTTKKESCFKEKTDTGKCGNGKVDEQEECDGGYLGRLGQDPCCNKKCKLIGLARCSPMQSACCLACQTAPQYIICNSGVHNALSCLGDSFCDGVNLNCPTPPHKPNGTTCLDQGKCHDGECLSFCEARGLISCVCENLDVVCMRCCRVSQLAKCSVYKAESVKLPDGRPCIRGYCKNGICKKIVQNLVQRFYNLIDDFTIDKAIEILKSNIVGFVVFLSLIIWLPVGCCIYYQDKKENEEDMRKNITFKQKARNLMGGMNLELMKLQESTERGN